MDTYMGYSIAGNFQPHTHVVGMDATTSDKETPAASFFLEGFELLYFIPLVFTIFKLQ